MHAATEPYSVCVCVCAVGGRVSVPMAANLMPFERTYPIIYGFNLIILSAGIVRLAPDARMNVHGV